jgi:hypothetical protein
MRKFLPLLCLLTLSAGIALRVPAAAAEDRTLFDLVEHAWAVGTLRLGKPLQFRDGKILAFPSQISDLLWAPNGTKPRNLMLIHERFRDDGDKSFLDYDDEIFAPLNLLPETSYWKDNLPNTPRHEVAGGRRYVFRGDDIAEARRVLEGYLVAHDTKGLERLSAKVGAVASALSSKSPVLREDAARYLANFPTLARDFPASSLPAVSAYLAGPSPEEEKGALLQALAEAKVEGLQASLSELAAKDDVTGAFALGGLETLGAPIAADRLAVLARAKTAEVRAFAAQALGKRGGSDPEALALATKLLESAGEAHVVREAAALGLSASGSAEAAGGGGGGGGRGGG